MVGWCNFTSLLEIAPCWVAFTVLGGSIRSLSLYSMVSYELCTICSLQLCWIDFFNQSVGRNGTLTKSMLVIPRYRTGFKQTLLRKYHIEVKV